MKTKKHISLILALLMVLTLFSGCKEEAPQSSSTPTQSTESEEMTLPSSEPTQPTENVESHAVNGVYATCGNYKYSIRTTANASIQFYLVTEKPLPKDAAITVDTESTCWFKITDRTPKQAYADYPTELAMWVEYGVDYESVFEHYEEKIQQVSNLNENKITIAEYDAFYEAHLTTWNEQFEPIYAKAWKKHVEVAPPCYLYEVDLRVKHTGTEVIKECQLVAGDMSRTIQIGEVTQLYEKNPYNYKLNVVGTGVKMADVADLNKEIPDFEAIRQSFNEDYLPGDADYPWCQSGYLSDTVYFVAQNDITLTDVQSLDGYYDIKAAELAVIGKNGVMMLSWTPGTELFIRKNETVVMRVYFDHPGLREAECSVRDELRIFYDDANGGGYIRQVYSFLRRRPLMEMYLWAFKGVDTKAYCERYQEYKRFIDEHPDGITRR